VEGSVRKDGQRIKISAQLVRTGDGYHIWSNSFERELKDVFAVQREIAESIASTLDQKLTGSKKERLAPYTANVEAFDLYMRGRHAAASPIPGEIDEAEALLQKASAADPAYPLPYVALAQLYVGADIVELRPTPVLVGKAREAISKALTLDNKIAEAHVILASLAARHEYDWAAAERHVRDALELEPNLAAAHFALAQHVFTPQGRWREAEAAQHRAMELDPGSPLGAISRPFLEQLQGHYDAAIAGFQRYAATYPLDPTPRWSVASSLAAKGDYAAAFQIYDRLLQKTPLPIHIAVSGFMHAHAGQMDEAQKALERLMAVSKTHFVSSSAFAVLYSGLNDRDHAFEYLERARRDQESFLMFARVNRFFFDALRPDPRYATLLSELRLDDASISKNQALSGLTHR
jgi:serine/threonine-protein kinase